MAVASPLLSFSTPGLVAAGSFPCSVSSDGQCDIENSFFPGPGLIQGESSPYEVIGGDLEIICIDFTGLWLSECVADFNSNGQKAFRII